MRIACARSGFELNDRTLSLEGGPAFRASGILWEALGLPYFETQKKHVLLI